jgi:hypothetical protein
MNALVLMQAKNDPIRLDVGAGWVRGAFPKAQPTPGFT